MAIRAKELPVATRQPRGRSRKIVALREHVSAETQSFASCRALGHEWKHQRPFSDGAGVLFQSDCTVCGTRRDRRITRSGDYKTRYVYAPHYSRHGDDRLTTVQWRQVLVTSAIGGGR
jgi:hypothetical protein